MADDLTKELRRRGGRQEEYKGNCGERKSEGDGRQGSKAPGRLGSRA